jgi:protein subunit release factor A
MKIVKSDLKIEYTRGTGAGGQHKNKTETCCEITHIPTGIKERCQDSRSKSTNYETALKRVTLRVEELAKQKKHNALNERRNQMLEEAGVIRTYNFQRSEVKDHRNKKTASLKKVLDGEIELLK